MRGIEDVRPSSNSSTLDFGPLPSFAISLSGAQLACCFVAFTASKQLNNTSKFVPRDCCRFAFADPTRPGSTAGIGSLPSSGGGDEHLRPDLRRRRGRRGGRYGLSPFSCCLYFRVPVWLCVPSCMVCGVLCRLSVCRVGMSRMSVGFCGGMDDVCIAACQSVCLSVCRVCLSICPSIYLPVCLPVYPSICLSVYVCPLVCVCLLGGVPQHLPPAFCFVFVGAFLAISAVISISYCCCSRL